MKKVILFLISVVCIVTCMVGFTACGEKETLTYTEFTDPYEKDEFGWDITGYSVKAANTDISGDIIIPATYNDKKVIAVASNGFANCSKITSVTVPENVTLISTNAFDGCNDNLTINLPSTIKTINITPAIKSFPKTINYNGTYAEWKKITMFYVCYSSRTIVNLLDGSIINNQFNKAE